MSRRPTVPLAVWVAVGGVTGVLAVVGTAAAGLLLAGVGLRAGVLLALAGAAGIGLLSTAVAVLLTTRLTAGLRELHVDAVRRLRDPRHRAEPGRYAGAARFGTELADLARVLDALQLRARVADEVAEQARRAAEQASAGMFELLSGLMAAEEATRGQLSAELHDTVAQSLAAARSLLAADPRTVGPDQVKELVEDAEEQVRAVMARARPAELREGDLASAVGALRRDFDTRYLLAVRLAWPERPTPLPLVSAVTVYRFFQEALLNVVKHAGVDDADVALTLDGDELVAVVRDAGPGFVPGEIRAVGGRHVGLGLLRERARLAGGSLRVDSVPGVGTTLTLRLPLPARPPNSS